jgi:hypothetical protein
MRCRCLSLTVGKRDRHHRCPGSPEIASRGVVTCLWHATDGVLTPIDFGAGVGLRWMLADASIKKRSALGGGQAGGYLVMFETEIVCARRQFKLASDPFGVACCDHRPGGRPLREGRPSRDRPTAGISAGWRTPNRGQPVIQFRIIPHVFFDQIRAFARRPRLGMRLGADIHLHLAGEREGLFGSKVRQNGSTVRKPISILYHRGPKRGS